MRITMTSVLVDDQAKALKFYSDDVELLLEPNTHPAAKPFQKALYHDGIPVTSFGSKDVRKDYEKLTKRGNLIQLHGSA